MTGTALIGAGLLGWGAAELAVIVASTVETESTIETIGTQAGVFGVVIAVALWLIRRSDSRESDQARVHSQIEHDLRQEITRLSEQVAALRETNAELRSRIDPPGGT